MPTETKAKKPKTVTLHKDGFKFDFWIEGKGRNAEVVCNAYKATENKDEKGHIVFEEKPCLEWAFPKVPGNNLYGNSAIFLEQAAIYAKEKNPTLKA